MQAGTKEAPQPLLRKLGQRMLKVQEEIDELAVQLSLSKDETKGKFEEVKKKFTGS